MAIVFTFEITNLNGEELSTMNDWNKPTRKDVADYMYLVASRNRDEIEKKSGPLILYLENQPGELKGLSLFVKGITAFFNNKYEESVQHFENAVAHDLNTTHVSGIAHMGLGLVNRSTGRMDAAVTHLFSAVELIGKSEDFNSFLNYCYQSLGEINASIQEFGMAIDFFNKANESSVADKTQASFFRFHVGIGGCYLKMKDYEKSKYHLTVALEVKDLPPPIISRVENDLGVLYLEIKEYEVAEKFLTHSLQVREANNLEDAACTSMTALAEVYLLQNKVSESLNLLNRCLILVDKFKTKWKKLEVLRLMAKAHSLTKDYELAVNYYEQYNALYAEVRSEQERNIFKFKNDQIEKQRKEISDKHQQLATTFDEVKRLKVNRKAVIFSWVTIITLVIISELFLDPMIENHTFNMELSLLAKVGIALLFKPIDGMYEKVLWNRAVKKVN